MITGILVVSVLALLAYLCSGARSLAYASYFLAYVPFITLDASTGGLTEITQLSGGNVLFKLGARALATSLLALVLWQRRADVLRVLASAASLPLLVLVLWALLGLPRTQDPWVPLFRLGELVVFYLTGAVLFVTRDHAAAPRAVLRWHCLALVPLLGVATWLAATRPELAFHTSSDGIQRMGHKFMNANVLGFAAVVVLLWSAFALGEPRERGWALDRLMPAVTLALAVYVLYHARSRTGTFTAVAGLVALYAPYWPSDRARTLRFLGGAALVGAIVALQADELLGYLLRGDSVDELATGTGRTGLWRDLLFEQVPRAPWLGAGYMMLSSEGGFLHAGHHWNNAHNTYLFALVSLGVPGFLCVTTLALLPLFVALGRLRHAPVDERAATALVVALMLVVVLTSIPEFGIVGYPNVTMLFHYGLYAFVVLRAPAPREARAGRPFHATALPGGAG